MLASSLLNMEYEIVKSESINIQKWNEGTTKELYIYPPSANYKSLDFDFRISTATVETEESSFTNLPSVLRELMVLNGEIEIKHKNHYTKKLRQFDIDKFEGDWETSSKGKCVDFNLMTMRDTNGQLSVNRQTNVDQLG